MSGRLARLLEALYGMEGHDVLAVKVRLSSHRSRKKGEAAASEEDARKITAQSREAARVDDAAEGSEPAAADTDRAASPQAAAPVVATSTRSRPGSSGAAA